METLHDSFGENCPFRNALDHHTVSLWLRGRREMEEIFGQNDVSWNHSVCSDRVLFAESDRERDLLHHRPN